MFLAVLLVIVGACATPESPILGPALMFAGIYFASKSDSEEPIIAVTFAIAAVGGFALLFF